MARSGSVDYARVGDSQVAYTVVDGNGDGTHTIVMVAGALFPFEALPEEPEVARLLEGLADLGRLVMFDRRGIGQSDPITDWSQRLVDQWADDLAAVIDATTTAPPVVFAWDCFGVGRALAARRPESVDRLVLFHPAQFDAAGADLASPVEELQGDILRLVRRENPDPGLMRAFQSRPDEAFRAWIDRAGRMGASPAVAERIWTSLFTQGAFTPPGITAPTLVLHRPDNPVSPPEVNGAVAGRILDARVVELPGSDLYPITDEVDAVVAEIGTFLTGTAHVPPPTRRMVAIVFADIVGSTARAAELGDSAWRQLLDLHDGAVRQAVGRSGGTFVKSTGDGALAVFPSASQAVRAAVAMRHEVGRHDLGLRIGIHVGEVDERAEDVSGIGVHVASRVMEAAGRGEIVASASTVMSTTGSGHRFESMGHQQLKGVPGNWELYRFEG